MSWTVQLLRSVLDAAACASACNLLVPSRQPAVQKAASRCLSAHAALSIPTKALGRKLDNGALMQAPKAALPTPPCWACKPGTYASAGTAKTRS
eukprot:366723-Amphidinium_carterae.1